MTVEMIIRIPGLLVVDTAGIVKANGLSALVVSKAVVITDGDVNEWITEDIDYIVSNQAGDDVDEVVEVTTATINDNQAGATLQSAVELALTAMSPGPVAAKWLTRVLEDDDFANRQVNKIAKKAAKAAPKETAKKAAPKQRRNKKAAADEEKWYLSNDGKGWTMDVTQAKLDKKGKPFQVSTEVARAS